MALASAPERIDLYPGEMTFVFSSKSFESGRFADMSVLMVSPSPEGLLDKPPKYFEAGHGTVQYN